MENITQFEDVLLESLKFSLVNKEVYREQSYSPQILVNDEEQRRYVLSDLQQELSKCISFKFSVAFVTQSGISLIKTQLHDLKLKGICGKLLISTYLDFNDPIVMRDLLKLTNLEVRLAPKEMQLHSKMYLFDQGNKKVLISGSSNLTSGALKMNYEWNIKLTSSQNGDFIHRANQEFERIWAKSIVLTEEIIDRYGKMRKVFISPDEIYTEKQTVYNLEILPNKMQERALSELEKTRLNGKCKAIIVSATGTGKTYLSAFDVKKYNPNRFLFLVHREQILSKSLESYKRVIGFEEHEACIYKSGMDIQNFKYIFSTIQTMSREENLNKFSKDYFDYILIDEVHKAGATSYKHVLEYFSPDFLLGMTATPERTDGQNIYELFDYNLVYEIRLQEALDNDLLCPFIYYGVTDISVDGKLIDDTAEFSNLVSSERVKHIFEKLNYYGHCGEKVKGLIFCSSVDESQQLSRIFNNAGFNTVSLSGQDSQAYREETIQNLENGIIDYIFTVDIFNEGIDIPSVNQVVMLRNTKSSIVFIQQLGRGLRKHHSKKYVTIIDFIGNYSNNYLIPVALFGDTSMNKDNYRRELRDPNIINGLTTINFEEIAKEQVFKSITNTSLSEMKKLREIFLEIKHRLGRIPKLSDYIYQNSIDPLVFFENSNFKNYIDVINKFTKEKTVVTSIEAKWLNFLTFEILNGKRKHELLLLKLLIENNGSFSVGQFKDLLIENGLETNNNVLNSVNSILNLTFLKKQEQKLYGTEPLMICSEGIYRLTCEFHDSLKNSTFLAQVEDIIETGLMISEKYPKIFTIGQKYSRRDVIKLLNISKDIPPLNIGGYIIDKTTNTCPIFITYHKSEDISDSIKYEDEFINESILKWFSKSKRTLSSPDVQAILNSHENGLKIELFVIKDDAEGGAFYYLGELEQIKDSENEEFNLQEESLISMLFRLKTPVENTLFKYITGR